MSDDDTIAVDSDKAREIWSQYQFQYDVSERLGEAVGIDPVSGRIWFGRKALDIARQMRAEGIDRPFYCVRVGSDFYGRKRRNCSKPRTLRLSVLECERRGVSPPVSHRSPAG